MNLKNNEAKELLAFGFILIVITAAFSFFVFGVAGLKVFLGIIFVSLPFYLMLNNFNLNEGEKFVFSLLLGFTMFSALAYLLGLLISFRLSILIVFLALLAAAFATNKFQRGK